MDHTKIPHPVLFTYYDRYCFAIKHKEPSTASSPDAPVPLSSSAEIDLI
jgi:hypothetical protein